jgi:signal peptidase I
MAGAGNPSPPRRPVRLALLAVLALALAGFLVVNLFLVVLPTLHVGRIFQVPNRGMTPILVRHDFVFSNELAFRHAKPARGDIVCFRGDHLPTLVRTDEMQVKRIVGLPGETISIREGALYVGDQPAAELVGRHYDTFQFDIFLTTREPSFTVPPESYFVLGDFPDGSYDSRFYGAVPMENIQGRAVFRIWPPARLGAIR